MNHKICTKTVIDTSDPDIQFDSNGISNNYWCAKNISDKYWHPNEYGKYQLGSIISEIKKSSLNNTYDCIIGLSGGLDSSYLLHKIVVDYGIKPLVFHVDGGWNSEIAVNNINNLVDSLDLELFTEVINWEEMREFQLAMFKSGVPHLDIPQDMAFIGVLYKYAAKYGIKYIFNGGNIASESMLPPLKYFYWGTDMSHVRDILRKFSRNKFQDFPFTSAFQTKFVARFVNGVKIIKPLNFLNYIKKDAENTLVNLYKYKTYPQKHFESIFTKFYEGYWLPTRFNFDIRRYQLSSLILSNQLKREEALKFLDKKPYDESNLNNEIKYVADKLRITVDELESYRLSRKKYYYDFKNSKKIFSIGERISKRILNTSRGGFY